MSGAGSPDFFCREAQRLGYVARSAFKLLQMQNQYKLISPGANSVLESWMRTRRLASGSMSEPGSVGEGRISHWH